MAEGTDCRFRGAFQNEGGIDTLRSNRKNSIPRQVSTDTNYYGLRCLVSPLELRASALKEDDSRGANQISIRESGTLSTEYNDSTARSNIASGNSEPHILKSSIETERRSEIHNAFVDSLSAISISDNGGGKYKDGENTDITLGEELDAFKDNSRIATLVDYEVLDSDPKELIYHIRCVANFGFDHIIIIGETEYGMIFLDCYDRVFLWENESQMLWPLGNSPEEASKRLVKGVDQGNVGIRIIAIDFSAGDLSFKIPRMNVIQNWMMSGYDGGELCFPQLQIIVPLCPGQVVAFSSRLLLHGNFPVTRGIRHRIVYFVHSMFFHHLRNFTEIYKDRKDGIERDVNGLVVPIIPQQDLNDAHGLNRQVRLDKPKANQIRVPPSSTDCRRGYIDLRRARWGLKAEDPLSDGILI
ncbi:5729_t:CDS:2 [Paraglomus brasilianum]|uniref:5729_t:CDS:1 n=1 Tax=Paraglomus brasilianum TaxID=144538 RepID=A0A9N9FH14_9GLOM|nr:5729_t:CDS:2 [Paraglomus brasilianum]